jgi:hypothetical protein
MGAGGAEPGVETERDLDPRLDTTAWRVFGRRFPRRWSLYFRIFAGILLVLALAWWFTRDVTYVGNVKVSGLDASIPAFREPLHLIADDLKGLANRLAADGFGWQPGGLPSLRAADSLSASEAATLVALGSLEVKSGDRGLRTGEEARRLADYLEGRGWTIPADTGSPLDGAFKDQGPLHAVVTVEERPEGRERLTMRITARSSG